MKSLFICLFILVAPVVADQHRHCIVLLDQDDECEHIGTETYFLMSKLQSALQDKGSPILVSAGLWHSFVERLIHYRQNRVDEDMPYYKIDRLYKNINKMVHDLSVERCTIHQIVQRVNQEFYKKENYVSGYDYQLILSHYTPLSKEEWSAYTNNKGYYLFVPKDYPHIAVDGLDELVYPEDPVYLYLKTARIGSFVDSLEDFFNPDDHYVWTLAIAGHGGSKYREYWKDEKVHWEADPLIADLTLSDFQQFLDYLDTRIHTHLLHYSGCYSGGNHIALAFEKSYSYPIICDVITDVASVCKKKIVLPSSEKKFITADDLTYSVETATWHLPLPQACLWGQFFAEIDKNDFSTASLVALPETLSLISNPTIANIAQLRLANSESFFPLHNSTVYTLGIEQESLTLFGKNVLLVEDAAIEYELFLKESPTVRIISTKPGDAVHYFKKIASSDYIDLASAFWQDYQKYDKTFLIDECTFPLTQVTKLFTGKKALLKNVLIQQRGRKYIRIFCIYKDKAIMFSAKKEVEREHPVKILEVIELTDLAKLEYEAYYNQKKAIDVPGSLNMAK